MSIIKQICFNNDTGRLILSDSNNNHFLCDIYGHSKKTFLPYISGVYIGELRVKNKLIKSIDTKTDTTYLPNIKKFEGYSQFPRPLVAPFSNTLEADFSSVAKKNLLNALRKYFTIEKAHHYLNATNDNKGIDYYTCDLNQYDTAKEDTALICKLIEDTFENHRQVHKYQLNVMHKNPIIKALSHFKQVLMENNSIKIVNGRKLIEPPEKIKELNICVNRLINRKGLVKKRNIINANQMTNPTFGNLITDLSPIKTTTSKAADLMLKDNEISFISNECENEKRYYDENVLLIKSTENMNKSIEREIKLLTGFIEESVKETGIVRKFKNKKWKNNGELYLNNLDLLHKVNPIAFKLQIEKDQYDLKQLRKKKLQSEINERNLGHNK